MTVLSGLSMNQVLTWFIEAAQNQALFSKFFCRFADKFLASSSFNSFAYLSDCSILDNETASSFSR